MSAYWESFIEWFMALGEPYGVNPVIFGSIYIGAVPFFWLAIAWLVRNIKQGKSVAGPVLMACACAVSAYVYLIIAGENVPLWVYVFIVMIIVYAVYSTLKKVRTKRNEVEQQQINEILQAEKLSMGNEANRSQTALSSSSKEVS